MIDKNNIKVFLRNPLSVVALFVTICYLIAGLVFSIGLDKLNGAEERLPFIWFIIIFPVIIFIGFMLLVWFHHEKLYGPSDFRDETNFTKLSQKELQNKYLKEATEHSIYEDTPPTIIEPSNDIIKKDKTNICAFAYSVEHSTHLAIKKLNQMYKTTFTEGIKYNKFVFDAMGIINGKMYIVECKYVKSIISMNPLAELN